MVRSRLLLCGLLAVLLSGVSDARSHRKKPQEPESAARFAYYLLSLSWAPDFCALPAGNKDPRECGKGRKVGFIVHGLWPQGETTRGPERCGNASPVGQEIVRVMLNYIPTESLIQHEWTNHGTCSGLSTADYFAAIRKARDSVKIPQEFEAPAQDMHMAPGQIAAKFAAANPKFPKGAFRVSCQSGALQEVRICFNKDLTARDCGASAGMCRMDEMLVRHVE